MASVESSFEGVVQHREPESPETSEFDVMCSLENRKHPKSNCANKRPLWRGRLCNIIVHLRFAHASHRCESTVDRDKTSPAQRTREKALPIKCGCLGAPRATLKTCGTLPLLDLKSHFWSEILRRAQSLTQWFENQDFKVSLVRLCLPPVTSDIRIRTNTTPRGESPVEAFSAMRRGKQTTARRSSRTRHICHTLPGVRGWGWTRHAASGVAN